MANDRFTFNSAGQIHKLEMALDRAGKWNAALVKRMCEGDRLTYIREYLLNLSEIKPIEYAIDCDADPFVPEGWKVEEHKKGGVLKWDTLEYAKEKYLYLSKSQKRGGLINGNKLRKILADEPVLNANVLDWLLKKEHQHLIPEELKDRNVYFLGTIYRNPDGGPCVRFLYWRGGGWLGGWSWLGDGCDVLGPALLSAGV